MGMKDDDGANEGEDATSLMNGNNLNACKKMEDEIDQTAHTMAEVAADEKCMEVPKCMENEKPPNPLGSAIRHCVNTGRPVALVRHTSTVRCPSHHHFSKMLFFCFLLTSIDISGVLYFILL